MRGIRVIRMYFVHAWNCQWTDPINKKKTYIPYIVKYFRGKETFFKTSIKILKV